MTHRLRISLVIPVYNEESHVEACLQSALQQQLPFYEIIVVDNNSSDNTAALAALFPGVRVLHEPRQGVVYARTTGFNAARGSIIARIDADTRLSPDWTQSLAEIFASGDIDAVSGRMEYHDMAAQRLIDRIDLFFRRYFARVLGREVALQAANMAIRRDTWRAVRESTCTKRNMHEDFDLAIHTNHAGYQVAFDERLVAKIGYRQAEASFRSFCTYAWLSPQTYRSHGLKSHRYMYPVVGLAIVSYGLLRLLHRGYDPVTTRFSWTKLVLTDSTMRVNPATYVE